ncbi:hypothetical protein KSP40_PGU017370 [Platanthera guangdongensis]|uniref:Uncharacterized protein n=1 Tax=Platanthera guangdongensis TaxID=2320717 RepID=A0ABR2N2C5_9ASPA
MSTGGVASAAASSAASAAVQSKEGSGHPSSQKPAGFGMLWNRPRNTLASDGDSLPEWKLNCLCSEQGLLSPTVKGGVHIGGGWF